MLSEADRDAASRYLSKLASDGTRDELGFAPIHFAFADRFFPGTSVQHAQIRYVFFVAWTYQELLAAADGSRFDRDRLFEIERRYSKRLMATTGELQNSGISGWMKYAADERPVVRASTIYWTALRSWRMAAPVARLPEPPTESQLQGLWPNLVARGDGENDKVSIQELFDGLPKPPAGWSGRTGRLDFDLRKPEAEYLRRRWRAAGAGGAQPLLSKLAEAGVTTRSLWSREVRDVADASERHDLVLAERAASAACIARAVHAALIEARRNVDRGTSDGTHADALPELVRRHRDQALSLDVEVLRTAIRIDGALAAFLETVLDWLRAGRPIEAIARAMERRESDLKHDRAFLVNEKRRRDWRKGVAQPLDYRWPVVRDMIASVRACA